MRTIPRRRYLYTDPATSGMAGYTYEKIAFRVGCSAGAVGSALSRERKRRGTVRLPEVEAFLADPDPKAKAPRLVYEDGEVKVVGDGLGHHGAKDRDRRGP